VQQRISGDKEKVFNLTLVDHNIYYANGILVSNCGRSPDLFDALAIGIEGARQRGFHILRLGSDKFKSEDQKWKRDLQSRAMALNKSGMLDHAA